MSAVKLVNFERVTCSFVGITCSFDAVTCSFDAITFRSVVPNDEYCNTYTVAEIQLNGGGGGGRGSKALRISDKFVLILHIFLITTEMYGNGKNHFLQTQRIRHVLDVFAISVVFHGY